MCGRFIVRRPWSEIHRLYRLTLDAGLNLRPSYNVAPSQISADELRSAFVEIADLACGRAATQTGGNCVASLALGHSGI
jgi:hypothetical protein